MITFVAWTAGVLVLVGLYVLWRRARSGRREQFRQRLTLLFLAFGLLPGILVVFFLTNTLNEIVGALSVPGVEAALRGAIETLQAGERAVEEELLKTLEEGGPEACLRDSTVVWIAWLPGDSTDAPARVWGDTGSALRFFRSGERDGSRLWERGIERILRYDRSDGEWILCRRYPEELGRALLDLRRSLHAYGTLALLRERLLEQQVFWAFGASVVALLAVLAVVAARATARRVAQPISLLGEAMDRVSGGDLDLTVPETGDEEIASLARAFNRMIAELRDSRERLARTERLVAWRDVARQVSHEIRNALTPAQLTLHRLRRRLPEEASEEHELLRSVESQLNVLSRLAEAFSQLGKLPEPKFEKTDINQLAREVVSLFDAEVHGIRFVFQPDQELPLVNVDRDRLRRVLNNLLRNAVESSRPRSRVWIRTRRAEEPGFTVALEVEDEGEGMAPEALANAFKPYFTTKPGGTGLGLFIVRQIVDEHGGRVELRSEPGVGTTVTILLP